jgi:hypothetical protein
MAFTEFELKGTGVTMVPKVVGEIAKKKPLSRKIAEPSWDGEADEDLGLWTLTFRSDNTTSKPVRASRFPLVARPSIGASVHWS